MTRATTSRAVTAIGAAVVPLNVSAPRAQDVDALLARMSREQKLALVDGAAAAGADAASDRVPGAAGSTRAFPELGLPALVMADGPAGLRIAPTRDDEEGTFYATAFPVATALASTWDVDLLERVGEAMGREARAYGVDIVLAPAMNIQRNPLGGRNFEYLTEEPFLNGHAAAALVEGIQASGVGATLKHFAANNQETNRFLLDTLVGERALREIYLRGFEIAVREAEPCAVMSAYNKINGVYSSQSPSSSPRRVLWCSSAISRSGHVLDVLQVVSDVGGGVDGIALFEIAAVARCGAGAGEHRELGPGLTRARELARDRGQRRRDVPGSGAFGRRRRARERR